MERKKGSSLDSHTELIHSRPLGGLESFKQKEVIGSSLCCGKTVLVERMADYTEGIRILVPRLTQDCQSEASRVSPLCAGDIAKEKLVWGLQGGLWAPRGQLSKCHFQGEGTCSWPPLA